MRKVQTGCCALSQLDQVNNDTPFELLQYNLKRLKKEKENNREIDITTGDGQTSTFTIVSPGEDVLESNLVKLGYKLVHTFPRRVGYPDTGDLKLYIINL